MRLGRRVEVIVTSLGVLVKFAEMEVLYSSRMLLSQLVPAAHAPAAAAGAMKGRVNALEEGEAAKVAPRCKGDVQPK